MSDEELKTLAAKHDIPETVIHLYFGAPILDRDAMIRALVARESERRSAIVPWLALILSLIAIAISIWAALYKKT